MLDQDLHLSHVSLPDPIAGLCCNEVNTDNSYTAKNWSLPKSHSHCEVCTVHKYMCNLYT